MHVYEIGCVVLLLVIYLPLSAVGHGHFGALAAERHDVESSQESAWSLAGSGPRSNRTRRHIPGNYYRLLDV